MSQANPKHSYDLKEVFGNATRPRLEWNDEIGVGYYPVKLAEGFYDDDYFDNYASYEGQEICEKLNQFRVELVNNFIEDDELVDVGIGAGTFIKDRGGKTFGTDINPAGIAWLKERNLYRHSKVRMTNASFWDSLEHFPDPSVPVALVEEVAFVSIPIFDDKSHVLRSKHYKKDEHYLYFSHDGLVDWFFEQGFDLLRNCDTESKIGRDGVSTYVFLRRKVL